MKLTATQPDLVAALKSAKTTAPAKATIPALRCALLTATDTLTVTATNLDQEVTLKSQAEITETGSALVPIEPAFTAVSRMPKSAIIKVETTERGITLTSGRTNIEIACEPVENYPRMASETYDHTFDVESHIVRLMFDRVKFAVSTEETRYYLNGVYMHTEEGVIVTTATDGHRFAKWQFNHDATFDGIIVPNDTIKMIDPPDGSIVTVSLSENKVRFSTEGWSLVSKVVDGTYPNYKRIIPADTGNSVSFVAKDMSNSIALTEAVQESRGSAIKLTIGGDGIEVSAKTQTGDVVGFVEGDVTGEGEVIGINSKYLNGLMSEFQGDCQMMYGRGTVPVKFTDSGDPDMLCVVMPMRVN